MSTILKALKKAESKPAIVHQRIDVEESFQREGLRSSGSFWKKRGGPYLLVALILCVVGAGVWRYIAPSPAPFEKQEVITYRIIKQPSNRIAKQSSSGRMAKQSSGEAIPASSQAQISNRGPDTKATVEQDRIEPKPIKPPVDKDISQQSSTVVLPKHLSPQKTVKPFAPTKNKTERIEPTSGKSDAPAPADVQPWRDAPPLENTKMRLQALAWAHQPEKRMVVIDGQVVREGDDVNGYTVARIRESDIILQQNKRYFRLAFNR